MRGTDFDFCQSKLCVGTGSYESDFVFTYVPGDNLSYTVAPTPSPSITSAPSSNTSSGTISSSSSSSIPWPRDAEAYAACTDAGVNDYCFSEWYIDEDTGAITNFEAAASTFQYPVRVRA